MAIIALVFSSTSTFGQGVTTAAINGVVVDQNGKPLPSATVVATHEPTGTVFGTTTRNNGRYDLLGLKVGGPYQIKVSYVGYKTELRDSIHLELGQNLRMNFRLVTTSVELSEVSVTARRNAVISSDRTGASQQVTTKEIQEIPAIARRFQDFSKLSPLFSGTNLSAAGRNNRYNNIQIDGTQYNDLFGLGSTGTPGGQADINAVSLDAIQQFQVVIAPYDVRLGGFTGGGINAITRSGSNTFEGSVYGYGRNQNFAGLSPDEKKTKLADFNEYLYGFRLGGPIMKDKLFFFTNLELKTHTSPSENISLTQGPANAQALADSMKSILVNKYGYNPGTYNSADLKIPSTKFFLRFDYNISENQKLTVRNNFVYGTDELFYYSRNSASNLVFSTDMYQFKSTTNSTVAQLNSTFSDKISNELILGYTTIRDKRGPEGSPMPQVDVRESGGFLLSAGLDRYSSANSLDQNIFEFTDNFTYLTGDHVITLGTHNEFFTFKNLFIRSFYGYYQYNSLADLAAGNVNFYQRVLSRTSNPRQPASFGVNQFGFYAQDEWTVAPNVKLTYGLRIDIPTFPDTPAKNDSVTKYFPNYSTTNVPSGNILWSPRIGFNWDINGDRTTQLRGGVGIFTGRIPYVWMSNNYGNTGTYYAEVDGGNGTIFSADPNNQPGIGAPGTGSPQLRSEIDMVNPNLRMPQVLRFDLAVDHQLPYGVIGTVEALYSKSINDMLYNKINLGPQVGTLSDGRPQYGPTNSGNGNFYDMLYLTNTSKGYQYNFVGQLQRNVATGISANIGFAYGRALDQNGVASSQAQSQMRYNPIDGNPNDPKLATSDYEIRDRLFASLAYSHEFFKGAPTTISLFYNGQTGFPYSFIVYGDINGDGFDQNDLFYIPKNSSDIELGTVANGAYVPASQSMYNDLNSFIENNDYLKSHRGQIAQRNATRNPWSDDVDLKISQDIPAFEGTHHFQISLDILNFLNLLNHKWGWVQTTGYNTYQIVKKEGVDPSNGHIVYSFSKPANNTPFTNDNLLSRWYMQLGLRYTF